MAAGYTVKTNGSVAATTGAKTLLMAIAPAGHGLLVCEMAISFDGTTSTATPAVVELVQSTQATAGTPGGSALIQQVRGRSTGGSAPTGSYGYTAEPTALTPIKDWFVPQFNGLFVLPYPLGREMETDSSAGTIRAIGIRLNVSAAVNVRAYLEVEAVG